MPGGSARNGKRTWIAVVGGVLLLGTITWGAPLEVCYPPVGCFPLTSPWYSWLRPLPAPQPADVIDTRVLLFHRRHVTGQQVTTRPQVDLTGLGFDASRRTFFVTHGFAHDGNATWLRGLKDALLEKLDANVFVVDWGKGAGQLDYLLVASNTRVVAAEIARLAKHLIDEHDADVASWHLIGHSLGAHIMAYVGKAVPGVGRLTALDPAQPAFEHFDARVRLDAQDTLLVDVVHTSARLFLPLPGLGMVAPHGHVDFYMNGGGEQPGCSTLLKMPTMNFDVFATRRAPMRVSDMTQAFGCPHERAFEYFTESIRSSCTFWGRRPEDIASLRECDVDRCAPFGLEVGLFPARGVFHINTNANAPFCVPDVAADEKMRHFRQRQPNDVDDKEEDDEEDDEKQVSNPFASFMFGSNRTHELNLGPMGKFTFRARWQ